jgi:hypothetical protein
MAKSNYDKELRENGVTIRRDKEADRLTRETGAPARPRDLSKQIIDQGFGSDGVVSVPRKKP